MISLKESWTLKSAAAALALTAGSALAAKNWSGWSEPASLEALPGSSPAINTGAVDGCASHSRDGLTIVFNSNRNGSQDLYMATRPSKSAGYGTPVPLPAPINTSDQEACPTLANGNRLYFSSDRDDPAYDIYVSRKGPTGWSAPTRLGPNINVQGMLDEAPDFYEDQQGREVMIFTRRNLAGTESKIYQSIDGGPASLLPGGPHSSAADARASVTKDGLTIFWDSTRSGGLGGPDIWYATRSNTSAPFGQAVHLSALSSSGFDARPYVSWDDSMLTFSSNRAGSESPAPDMWFATRDQVTGN